ncbi:hypothetical protein BC937DRAFT_92711 [Endogone sp. FLAS-F59071]|nr:hypothetical protein BC937DRAFT_92711 [Endogone sp. FLAS-F59071]|eukprot:RUS21431.1 hypothetical protein BC937DRAFT_92711 [Endogone sp. FLAS-F59071]
MNSPTIFSSLPSSSGLLSSHLLTSPRSLRICLPLAQASKPFALCPTSLNLKNPSHQQPYAAFRLSIEHGCVNLAFCRLLTFPTFAIEISIPKQLTRQQYDEAKHELQALLSRKKIVDANLATLETNIYNFEGSYLEDTQQNGNIIRGFDGYVNNRSDKKKQRFTEQDRLFSQSSTTYLKALSLKEEKDQESSQDERSSNHGGSSRKDRKKNRLKHISSMGSGSGPGTPGTSGTESVKRKKMRMSSTGSKDTEEELDV